MDREACKLRAEHLQDEAEKLWTENVSKCIFSRRETCCPPSASYNKKDPAFLVFLISFAAMRNEMKPV